MPARLIAAIPTVLEALDAEMGDDFSQPARLLMFEADDDGVTFGIKELAAGQHPLDELLGFVAPDAWSAFGTVCHGWATHDVGRRPSRAADRVRVRSMHMVARDGTELGGFRLSGGALELQELVIGMVPDALRRCLGLPTPAPDFLAAEVTTADWLDDIAEDRTAAAHLPVPYTKWEDVRWDVITGRRVVKDLTPTLATWMDVGMFARWMAGTYPRTADHLAAVQRVVDPAVHKAISRALTKWKLL